MNCPMNKMLARLANSFAENFPSLLGSGFDRVLLFAGGVDAIFIILSENPSAQFGLFKALLN